MEIVIEQTRVTERSYCGPPAFFIIKQSMISVLAKFHAGYFRISLSLCGQALLWKILGESADDAHALRRMFRMIPSTAFILLWSLALFTGELSFCSLDFLATLASIDSIHHSTNWILYAVLWWVFVVPVVILDVKIYGQWFTKGKRFLSTVANPTSQLSVIGNLVGARARGAAEMGWKESAICFFSLGMAHYLVLFVTLYQRLSGDNSLPTMFRPVFFLFFAAPGVASLARDSISGSFDCSTKMLFFLSFFLFLSLVCRPTLFWKSMRKFSVAWWAHSFPLTVLALASVDYAQEVKGLLAHGIMLLLSLLSVVVSLSLMLFTALRVNTNTNTQTLFPPSVSTSPAKTITLT